MTDYKHPALTKEHQMIRESVRQFAKNVIKPQAKSLDEKEAFSVDITEKMGEAGLFGINCPQAYGGAAMDARSFIIAVEELARVDASQASTVAAHNSLGIAPILEFGTDAQKKQYLPGLCTGKQLWAFALTEPEAGSDSRATKTTAVLDGNQWVINGSKIFITNASSALSKGFTVQCIFKNADGQQVFNTILVEKDTPGVSVRTMRGKMVWRASDTAEIFFDNVKVPFANLLGKEGEGSKIMLKTLDSGRLSIAAMGLGLAQGAYEMALHYAKKRTQFSKPIADFQVNAFKLADMATKIELARNILYRACWLKDQGSPYAVESAMAKLYCSEIAKEVADESLQLHGGYGLMKEFDIERFYRDQRILQIGEGTSEIQRVIISKNILKG